MGGGGVLIANRLMGAHVRHPFGRARSHVLASRRTHSRALQAPAMDALAEGREKEHHPIYPGTSLYTLGN